MLLEIDTFLLERIFTPFAWWFERKTGRTNFFLAWWCYGIALLGIVFSVGLGVTQTHDFGIDVVIGSLLIIGCGGMLMRAQYLNERITRDPAVLPAPRGTADRLLRVGLALLTVLCIVQVLLETHSINSIMSDPRVLKRFVWLLGSGTYVLAIYFMDVQRPPPRRNKEHVRDLQPAPIRS